MNTVHKGVNYETRALLKYGDFYAKDVNEACDFLDWVAQDASEFKISCANSYIPSP